MYVVRNSSNSYHNDLYLLAEELFIVIKITIIFFLLLLLNVSFCNHIAALYATIL